MKIEYIKLKQYKYELKEDLSIQIPLFGYRFDHKFFSLSVDGFLVIKKGYKWDGVSGPMWDTENSMIGGCVHDSLYQAIRLRELPFKCKNKCDEIMKNLFRACGMSKFRSGYAEFAVNKFGWSSCVPGDIKIPNNITLEC